MAQLESSSLVAVLGQSILISFTTGAPIQLRDRECVRVCVRVGAKERERERERENERQKG